ncbi:MAG: chemotaxis protein CheW [Reinekea sp.]
MTEKNSPDHGEEELSESHSNDQYLTFVMDDEEYGVDILSVQEIRGWEKPTKIPNASSYLKGVINLRGTIVPIVDLRARFHLKEVEYTPVTVVIVLKLVSDNLSRTVGIVVDAVSDVYSIIAEDIREPPDIRNSENRQFIKGLANVGKKMVIILNLSGLLDDDELTEA